MDRTCDICFEVREDFVTCRTSDKHEWCVDCYRSIVLSRRDNCPFCRSPMVPELPEMPEIIFDPNQHLEAAMIPLPDDDDDF